MWLQKVISKKAKCPGSLKEDFLLTYNFILWFPGPGSGTSLPKCNRDQNLNIFSLFNLYSLFGFIWCSAFKTASSGAPQIPLCLRCWDETQECLRVHRQPEALKGLGHLMDIYFAALFNRISTYFLYVHAQIVFKFWPDRFNRKKCKVSDFLRCRFMAGLRNNF